MNEPARPVDRELQMLTRLCRADEVPERGVKQVTPPGSDKEYAVYRLDGEFYASDDMCTHGLVSLSYGEVDDGQIHCPMHGGAFFLRTGQPSAAPCRMPLKMYQVVVVDGELFADLG
jgi:nitrite reductase/ring-hydroxylating ferredoxin subunit